MSHITGLLVVDAPASALNNAGKDEERTDNANAVAVKLIRAQEGWYPYISAQAVRFWLRTALAQDNEWTASPVFRESKNAYTDAEPTKYAEDDLFGYMRAASKATDEAKTQKRAQIAEKATPIDPGIGEVTRVSPFRVGTLVAVRQVWITNDYGTMARAEGNPVPHEHQFYRTHLKAPFGLDLMCAGTFFASARVGYKNIDKHRIESATKAGAKELEIRGFKAYRLPFATRVQRVGKLVRAIGRLEGGAKQTLHLTDTTPSVLVLAVLKHGNQPFLRLFTPSPTGQTELRLDVLEEALRVFKDDLLSDIHFGWATGFLDEERKKLEAFAKDASKTQGKRILITHPREAADAFAKALENPEHEPWFS